VAQVDSEDNAVPISAPDERDRSMLIKPPLAAALLMLAMTSGALAQQTQGQDDQSTEARQTTSASLSSFGTQPEQAGDLYQARIRNTDNFGGGAPQTSILPGALNPGTDSLDDGRQPNPRD
jgi:hypothetical protein